MDILEEAAEKSDAVVEAEETIAAASLSARRLRSKLPLSKTLRKSPLLSAEGATEVEEIAVNEDELDAATADGDDTEAGLPVTPKTNWKMMVMMIILRLVMSFLPIIMRRLRGDPTAEAGEAAAASGAAALGGFFSAFAAAKAKFVEFVRSPQAAPFVMGLMIVSLKLLKRLDEGSAAAVDDVLADEAEVAEADGGVVIEEAEDDSGADAAAEGDANEADGVEGSTEDVSAAAGEEEGEEAATVAEDEADGGR